MKTILPLLGKDKRVGNNQYPPQSLTNERESIQSFRKVKIKININFCKYLCENSKEFPLKTVYIHVISVHVQNRTFEVYDEDKENKQKKNNSIYIKLFACDAAIICLSGSGINDN